MDADVPGSNKRQEAAELGEMGDRVRSKRLSIGAAGVTAIGESEALQ